MAGLIRVTALATSRRRAGFAFTREPLVLGRESFDEDALEALRQLGAIAIDPALRLEGSDPENPEGFAEVSHDDRLALADMVTAAELSADDDEHRDAIATIVDRLLGEAEFVRPEGPEGDDDDANALTPGSEGKADGGTLAAPAVEPPPASDASAVSGEQSRAGADAAGAPAADASVEKQPGDTEQPPVADGTTPAAAPAAEAANPAAAAPAAPAAPEPEKGAAVPAKAKAKADAKPQSSSGRQSKAANAGAAKG